MPDKEREANFAKMVAEARARYDAMTPEQKAAHDNAKRESWVRGMTGDEGTTLIKPVSSAAAGKSREDVRSQTIEECARTLQTEVRNPIKIIAVTQHADDVGGAVVLWTTYLASAIRSLPPPSVEEGGEQRPPLKAEFTKSLPGGTIDDATFELIESALDRADAPCQDASGRWLKLHERISELTALRKAGEGAVAVAWSAVNPDGETVTTHDGCAAEYWADEGWPVTPLYAHPSPAVVGEGWRDISTAPRTDAATMVAKPFLAWCPDKTSTLGGDMRIVWWEPVTNGGCWWSDRDLEEHPTHYMPLPASPSFPKKDSE